jgi:hypothetical protein
MAAYRTLRAIAKRMGWKSASTVLRRHNLDRFPLYPDLSKRSLIWATSDALIDLWEADKVKYSGHRLRRPGDGATSRATGPITVACASKIKQTLAQGQACRP